MKLLLNDEGLSSALQINHQSSEEVLIQMSYFIHEKIVWPNLPQWQGDMNLSSRLVWLRISMRLIESGYFWRERGVPLHSK